MHLFVYIILYNVFFDSCFGSVEVVAWLLKGTFVEHQTEDVVREMCRILSCIWSLSFNLLMSENIWSNLYEICVLLENSVGAFRKVNQLQS